MYVTEKQYVLIFFLEYIDYTISLEALDFHVKNEKSTVTTIIKTQKNYFQNNIRLTKCMILHTKIKYKGIQCII